MKETMTRNERLRNLPTALVPWFRENGRKLPWRQAPTPYHVWISEIMLQQTRIEAVKPYYSRFLAEFPDIPALAAAEPDRLMKLWEGLGYYSRARNLQEAAREMTEKYGGEFPREYEQIRALKGIGAYTAGAIASICFGLPVPAVDGNVLRVISRITGDDRPVTDEKIKAEVRADLAAVYPKEAGIFTQALMELGEVVCVPNGTPDCARCPCRSFCASRDGEWRRLPVKAPKKPRRQEALTVFLLCCGDRFAVRKRGENGLLAGLWEFPNCPGTLSAEEAFAQAANWGCAPQGLREEAPKTHVFTHVEWKMTCFTVVCGEAPDAFVWATPAELRKTYSLPTAFRKVLL